MTSATPDRTNEWRHVSGVKSATYVNPDGTSFSNVKIKIGAYSGGDFAGGMGVATPSVVITCWPKAGYGAGHPVTIDPEGTFTLDGSTYQVTAIRNKRYDGSQVVVDCLEQQ